MQYSIYKVRCTDQHKATKTKCHWADCKYEPVAFVSSAKDARKLAADNAPAWIFRGREGSGFERLIAEVGF